jgi:hypothetical protein
VAPGNDVLLKLKPTIYAITNEAKVSYNFSVYIVLIRHLTDALTLGLITNCSANTFIFCNYNYESVSI